MDIELRSARKSDFPQIIGLLERCFDEAAPGFFAAQTEHDSTFRLRHARVAELDGRIAGYVRIFARGMRAGGAVVHAGGIGSVATHPDAQHRGIATALLEDAIAQMRREGMAVAFLFTGIPEFYQRVGFRIALQPEIRVPRNALPSAHTERVRALDMTTDLGACAAVYRRVTAAATGAIVRTRRTWADALNWLDEGDGYVALDDAGRIVAYVRARCRDVGHQILEAESAPGHAEELEALLAALSGNRCACGSFVASVSAEHPLATILRALPGAVETTDVAHPMMLRVLSDDPQLMGAFEREPMYFWNSDRI